MGKFHSNRATAQPHRGFFAARFASKIGLPSAAEPGHVIAKWVEKNPVAQRVSLYCQNVASARAFTINSYCPQLADRLILNCQKSPDKNAARLTFNDYQRAFYSSLDNLHPNFSPDFKTALKILHGCAILRVAHPAMIKALESVSSNPRLLLRDHSQSGIKDPIRLLLDLSRRSNISAINATETFNDCIEKLFPLVRYSYDKKEKTINLLYAQITANASNFSFDLDSAQRRLSEIGAVGLSPKINSSMAVMWRFCTPERPLPQYIIKALSQKNSKMQRGTTEAKYSKNIIAAINVSFQRYSLQYKIQTNAPLPDQHGPFNSDFVITGQDQHANPNYS